MAEKGFKPEACPLKLCCLWTPLTPLGNSRNFWELAEAGRTLPGPPEKLSLLTPYSWRFGLQTHERMIWCLAQCVVISPWLPRTSHLGALAPER